MGTTKKEEPTSVGFYRFSILIFFGVGAVLGLLYPRNPTVMTQIVPQVCSSTVNIHEPPTPESCEAYVSARKEETGGPWPAPTTMSPESLVTSAVGKWRAVDGSVSAEIDPPREPSKKRPPYRMVVTSGKDTYGCEFSPAATIPDTHGPRKGDTRYQAWCGEKRTGLLFLRVDGDELHLSLKLDEVWEVSGARLTKR